MVTHECKKETEREREKRKRRKRERRQRSGRGRESGGNLRGGNLENKKQEKIIWVQIYGKWYYCHILVI